MSRYISKKNLRGASKKKFRGASKKKFRGASKKKFGGSCLGEACPKQHSISGDTVYDTENINVSNTLYVIPKTDNKVTTDEFNKFCNEFIKFPQKLAMVNKPFTSSNAIRSIETSFNVKFNHDIKGITGNPNIGISSAPPNPSQFIEKLTTYITDNMIQQQKKGIFIVSHSKFMSKLVEDFLRKSPDTTLYTDNVFTGNINSFDGKYIAPNIGFNKLDILHLQYDTFEKKFLNMTIRRNDKGYNINKLINADKGDPLASEHYRRWGILTGILDELNSYKNYVDNKMSFTKAMENLNPRDVEDNKIKKGERVYINSSDESYYINWLRVGGSFTDEELKILKESIPAKQLKKFKLTSEEKKIYVDDFLKLKTKEERENYKQQKTEELVQMDDDMNPRMYQHIKNYYDNDIDLYLAPQETTTNVKIYDQKLVDIPGSSNTPVNPIEQIKKTRNRIINIFIMRNCETCNNITNKKTQKIKQYLTNKSQNGYLNWSMCLPRTITEIYNKRSDLLELLKKYCFFDHPDDKDIYKCIDQIVFGSSVMFSSILTSLFLYNCLSDANSLTPPTIQAQVIFSWKEHNESITVSNIPENRSIEIKEGNIMSYISARDNKTMKYIHIKGFKSSMDKPPEKILYLVYSKNHKNNWIWDGDSIKRYGIEKTLGIDPYTFKNFKNLKITTLTKKQAEEAAEKAESQI